MLNRSAVVETALVETGSNRKSGISLPVASPTDEARLPESTVCDVCQQTRICQTDASVRPDVAQDKLNTNGNGLDGMGVS